MSATVQVTLKPRATSENQNMDSWPHTYSGEFAVEELVQTNRNRERSGDETDMKR